MIIPPSFVGLFNPRYPSLNEYSGRRPVPPFDHSIPFDHCDDQFQSKNCFPHSFVHPTEDRDDKQERPVSVITLSSDSDDETSFHCRRSVIHSNCRVKSLGLNSFRIVRPELIRDKNNFNEQNREENCLECGKMSHHCEYFSHHCHRSNIKRERISIDHRITVRFFSFLFSMKLNWGGGDISLEWVNNRSRIQ